MMLKREVESVAVATAAPIVVVGLAAVAFVVAAKVVELVTVPAAPPPEPIAPVIRDLPARPAPTLTWSSTTTLGTVEPGPISAY